MSLKSGVTVQETTAGAAARCLAESELVLLRKVAQRRVAERQAVALSEAEGKPTKTGPGTSSDGSISSKA